MVEWIAKGRFSSAVDDRLAALEKEKADCAKELKEIELQTQVLQYDIEAVKKAAKTILSSLQSTDSAKLEEVFNVMVDMIILYETGVEICLSLAYLFVVYNIGVEPPQPQKRLISYEIRRFSLLFVTFFLCAICL